MDADGYAYELKQALLPRGACGTVVELCRQGEGVEVALEAEQQEDGGFFFAALWVLRGEFGGNRLSGQSAKIRQLSVSGHESGCDCRRDDSARCLRFRVVGIFIMGSVED